MSAICKHGQNPSLDKSKVPGKVLIVRLNIYIFIDL